MSYFRKRKAIEALYQTPKLHILSPIRIRPQKSPKTEIETNKKILKLLKIEKNLQNNLNELRRSLQFFMCQNKKKMCLITIVLIEND